MYRLSAIFAISISLLSCHPSPLMTTAPVHNLMAQSIHGHIELPSQWRLAANPADIQPFATVALLYPPDHAEHPGALVASGRSDSHGSFDFRVPDGTTLSADSVYILEASRRLGSHGTESQSLRTLLRWSGHTWTALTTPSIVISTKTTALVQALELDATLTAAHLFGAVTVNQGATVFTAPIGSHTLPVLNQVAAMVDELLEQGRDPIAHLGFQQGKFHVKKPVNPQISWLNQKSHCPACNLVHEGLDNLDLSGKDFSHQDLTQSRLTGANLSNINGLASDFSHALLNNANLTAAHLEDADFSHANLLGSNLHQSDLTGSNFSYANLTGLDLRTSLIDNANFSHAQLNGVNLSGVVFPTLNLTQTSMRMANLQAANLNNKALTGTDLRDANLRNAQFANSQLTQVKLDNAQLQGSNFLNANLGQISLDGAILDGATWVGGQTCATPSRSVCRYEWIANTTTVGNQQYPSVATAADGSSIVVWNNGSAAPHIMGQRYDPYGTPIGSPVQISQTLAEPYSEPDVAMAADGRFVVTWDHNNDGNNWGIIARRFNADGTAPANEFIANTHTTGNQWYPAVAMSPDGRFVIAWSDAGLGATYYRRFEADGSSNMAQDTVSPASQQVDVTANNDYFAFSWTAADNNGNGVYARLQRHDPSNQQFSPFQLNSYTSGQQQLSSIALANTNPLGTTHLATTWQSQFQDGHGTGVFARYMSVASQNATGLTTGSEFQVNSYTTADQINPFVAIDYTGNFIVTWQSAGQDGSPNSIYAQRFNARYGTPFGSEFKVNQYSADNQTFPAIALAPNRHITAAWTTQGQDGNGVGVAATQFAY